MNSLVSVVIPCRNEETHIKKCLDSIVTNDYPKDQIEILVIDGMSDDRSREIVEGYIAKYPFIRLLENPRKIIPVAWNIGITHAKGDVILRLSAHGSCEKDYISKCLEYLTEYGADDVGGVWKTVPGDDTLLAKAIALALSHPFGVGNAHYRIGQSEEPRWVDTVPFGCCKREVFDKVGLFNEDLARSEDMDFSLRLKQAGGKILLVPELVSYYHARSNFKAFYKHSFLNGIWVTYPLKFGAKPFSWRHLVPLTFVLALIGSVVLSILFPTLWFLFPAVLGSYALLNFFFSFRIAVREKNVRYLFVMPIVFATLHVCYGWGSLVGLLRVINPKMHGQREVPVIR